MVVPVLASKVGAKYTVRALCLMSICQPSYHCIHCTLLYIYLCPYVQVTIQSRLKSPSSAFKKMVGVAGFRWLYFYNIVILFNAD